MTGGFEAKNPDFAARVRDSFSRQPFMDHLGCRLTVVEPGICEIELPYRAELGQQHGFFHGGSIASVLDNAAGYAAFSLMPVDSSVLTVEYKLNFVAPGRGERIVGRAKVARSGRTLSVVHADAYAVAGGVETLCAVSIQTIMAMHGRPDDAGVPS